jgi:hypothetical protein
MCQQHLGYLPAFVDVLEQICTYLYQQLNLLLCMDVVVFPGRLHCGLSSDAEMMDLGPRGMYPYYPALDDFWV